MMADEFTGQVGDLASCLFARLRAVAVAAVVGLTLLAGSPAGGADWSTIVDDSFDGGTLSPDWRVQRGEWWLADGQLRVDRPWPSDNRFLCTRPHPRDGVRASVTLTLPADAAATINLRGGETEWGGGGIVDVYGVHVQAAAGNTAVRQEGKSIQVIPDTPVLVVVEIDAGQATVSVNGERLWQDPLPPARSEIGRYFDMNVLPAGAIDRIHLESRAGESTALPIAPNSAAENRQATVEATPDPERAGAGLQAAIDRLPANGGVVILPAGTFELRRHLRVPSNTTLRGQGAGQTVLSIPAPHQTAVVEVLSEDAGTIVVTVQDASRFRVGDAVCFDQGWGHCQSSRDSGEPNKEITVTAIAANTLTLHGVAPAAARNTRKSLSAVFPILYGSHGQFIEFTDMTLLSALDPTVKAGGGFSTCPVTLGNVYGARVARVAINGSRADGLSAQACGDLMAVDNTISGVAQGFHPGTRTQRLIFARNLSVDNRVGMFYCYNNENGVYLQNDFGSGIAGYPGAGDVFNLMAGNRYTGTVTVEGVYAGLWYHNRCDRVEFLEPSRPGPYAYASAGRAFLFAETALDELAVTDSAQGNLFVGLPTLADDDAMRDHLATIARRNTVDRTGPRLAETLGLPRGAARNQPVPPPVSKLPILDARTLYTPGAPDCGFQAGLNQLAAAGGTLLLPGGRYPLAQALVIPDGVVLAGQGIGSMLYAADGYTGSLLTVTAGNVTVRDLTILGRYEAAGTQAPAIAVSAANRVTVVGVDFRGWDGDGIRAMASAIRVADCRFLALAGTAVRLEHGALDLRTSIIRECAAGLVLARPQPGSQIVGNVISGCRGVGISVDQAASPLIYANNISHQHADGIRVVGSTQATVLANVLRGNNRANGDGAGITLQASSQSTVSCNLCTDDDLIRSQSVAIRETADCAENLLSYNLTYPVFSDPLHRTTATIQSAGHGTRLEQNADTTPLPSGSTAELRSQTQTTGAE